jgi:hypothetical protein
VHSRPGLLVETHSLKSHRAQLWAHYDLMVHTIDYVAKNAAALKKLNIEADQQLIAMGAEHNPNNRLFLASEVHPKGEKMILKGVSGKVVKSKISGDLVMAYGTDPIDIPTMFYGKIRTVADASIPLGYAIPVEWNQVTDLLQLHGVTTEILADETEDEMEGYTVSDVSWAPKPFEGRHLVTCKTTTFHGTHRLPAGTIYVPMNQRTARVVLNLLEPRGVDSLVRWGFFDTIFEQKEDFEDYLMEPIARRMLQLQPSLEKTFRQRLKRDAALRESPKARLRFFYERSGYAEPDRNVYPILRVLKFHK